MFCELWKENLQNIMLAYENRMPGMTLTKLKHRSLGTSSVRELRCSRTLSILQYAYVFLFSFLLYCFSFVEVCCYMAQVTCCIENICKKLFLATYVFWYNCHINGKVYNQMGAFRYSLFVGKHLGHISQLLPRLPVAQPMLFKWARQLGWSGQ